MLNSSIDQRVYLGLIISNRVGDLTKEQLGVIQDVCRGYSRSFVMPLDTY